MDLSIDQQKKLLLYAKKTIADHLNIKTNYDYPEMKDPVFSEKLGAFVTIHLNGNLRGCIGYIKGFLPLIETIQEMAESAAFRDPRFAPLSVQEFSLIDIEISILSPIVKVDSIDDIVVGRDGLIIKKGTRSGLLLPQVATEYGWGKEEFLQHTCMKAGLQKDDWKSKGIVIEKFSASVFGEKELGII